MSRHHHFEEERKPDTREAGQEHMDGEQNVPSEGCVPDGEELERLCREQICPTCDTGSRGNPASRACGNGQL